MKNNERFLKLITDHYNGEPWLDISFKTTIANVSSNDAVKSLTTRTGSFILMGFVYAKLLVEA